jgi:AraC-like DNA-binding protein/ligand-binding sensor protein
MNASLLPQTQPAADRPDNSSFVARLQASKLFREYQEAFETATGLPLTIRAVASFQPPLQGSKLANPFCALMAGTSRNCAACLQLQAQVESAAINDASTLKCFAGLSESLVPVRLGDDVVAFLQTGQVFLRPPSDRNFRAAMAQLEKWKGVVDVDQLRAAYFETRVLTKSRYTAVVRLLASFARHLSLLSNEVMIKEAAAEPPAVTKARAFIAEHLGESLSLEQVAHAANMSAFYFCKVFKTATGLTFTDYVARARVEKTKQLLLNPHTRVSEAAYEAGFQSLSQFNRVFRRVERQSPSDYRDHLHPASGARSTLARAA